METSLIASVNAGLTKEVGTHLIKKVKNEKRKEDNPNKVQPVPIVAPISKYFSYNSKGEYLAHPKDSHYVDLKA